MKILKLTVLPFLFVFASTPSFTQDTIHWRSDYKLKWEDFQGKPDSSKIDLANSYIRIDYIYHITNSQLEYKVTCYFLKKISWAKYNMPALMDHEQGHFDIAKLLALKLEKKFREYRITNNSLVYHDLNSLYEAILKEKTEMDFSYDKIEKENPMTDVPQKEFLENIRKQITPAPKKYGLKKNKPRTLK